MAVKPRGDARQPYLRYKQEQDRAISKALLTYWQQQKVRMEGVLKEFAPAKLSPWDAFWANEQRILLAILLPRLAETAFGGIHESEVLSHKIGLGLDFALAHQNALNYVQSQALLHSSWLNRTTMRSFNTRLAEWIQTPGQTIGDLTDDLYQIYGNRSRAMQAAISMVTDIYAEGSLIGWRQLELHNGGLTFYKVWNTNADDWVCPVCRPLNGERVLLSGHFRGGLDRPKAHHGCRCWLTMEVDIPAVKGGPGSGHFGHRGRPGKRGGSLPGTAGSALIASLGDDWTGQIHTVDDWAPSTPGDPATIEALTAAGPGDTWAMAEELGLDSKLDHFERINRKWVFEEDPDAKYTIRGFLEKNQDLRTVTLYEWYSGQYGSPDVEHFPAFDAWLETPQLIFRGGDPHEEVFSGWTWNPRTAERFGGVQALEITPAQTLGYSLSGEGEIYVDSEFISIAPTKGGPGSGHFGHRGRPGKRGGSLPAGAGGVMIAASGLDKAGRRKARRIRDDYEKGILTREEAEAQMEALGADSSYIEKLLGESSSSSQTGLKPKGSLKSKEEIAQRRKAYQQECNRSQREYDRAASDYDHWEAGEFREKQLELQEKHKNPETGRTNWEGYFNDPDYIALKEERSRRREIMNTAREQYEQQQKDLLVKHFGIGDHFEVRCVYGPKAQRTHGATKDEWDEGFDFVSQFVAKEGMSNPNAKVRVYKKKKNQVANYNPRDSRIYLDAQSSRVSAAHELGHWLDDIGYNQGHISKEVNFILTRSGGSTSWSGGGKSRYRYYQWNDQFDTYTGRIPYNELECFGFGDPDKFIATEVLSTGLEHLVRNPHKFAGQDPEHFELVMEIIQGE